MITSIYPLCGGTIPINETQIAICTKNKGWEAVCLIHEFSQELKDYIKNNGGTEKNR